jgi:hypothetical protein
MVFGKASGSANKERILLFICSVSKLLVFKLSICISKVFEKSDIEKIKGNFTDFPQV